MEKCPHCPLLRFEETKDLNCVSLKHPRYCELSKESAAYDEAILRKSAKSMGDEVIPSLLERARNASVALLKIGAQTLKGRTVLVPPEVKQARVDKCYGCVKHYNAQSDTCSHPSCGCYITKNPIEGLLAKTDVATEKCPIGEWGEYNEPSVTMHIASTTSQPSSGCGCGK